MVAAWTEADLEAFGSADEIDIRSLRDDGSARPWVTIWMVRVGDGLFVRSAYGSENGWFRRAKAAGAGGIRFGGLERDVTFKATEPQLAAAIDAAYHAKYDQYAKAIVDTVVSAEAARDTLRVMPRDHT